MRLFWAFLGQLAWLKFTKEQTFSYRVHDNSVHNAWRNAKMQQYYTDYHAKEKAWKRG